MFVKTQKRPAFLTDFSTQSGESIEMVSKNPYPFSSDGSASIIDQLAFPLLMCPHCWTFLSAYLVPNSAPPVSENGHQEFSAFKKRVRLCTTNEWLKKQMPACKVSGGARLRSLGLDQLHYSFPNLFQQAQIKLMKHVRRACTIDAILAWRRPPVMHVRKISENECRSTTI